MIRVEFSGDDFTGFAAGAAAELRPAMERAVLAGALVFHGAVKRKLSRKGTGRLYRRGKRRVHVASRPGEPPAVDTGRLRNSIAWTPPKWLNADTVASEVGTNVEYARIHEFGGRTGRNGAVRLRPRAYFRPALEESAPAIERAMRNALG